MDKPKRTFEEAEAKGKRLLPATLRMIGDRLESDDMVETTVLYQAADEIEELRAEIVYLRVDKNQKRACQCGEDDDCQRVLEIEKLWLENERLRSGNNKPEES